MISKDLLQQAVDKNILKADQLEPLYEFITNKELVPVADTREEPLKFIRSFGDVFITIGLLLLVIAINMLDLSGYYYFIPVLGFVAVAEWLVRVRRLALPGIAILISILFFVNKAIAFDHEHATTLGLAILSISSLLFYLRYKMPFSLLPLAAGLVAITVIQIGLDVVKHPVIFVFLGLVVFSVAMWFDCRDTKRLSHLSDSAFWLHLLAAPLIVHGAMVSMLFSEQSWVQAMSEEMLIVIFFIGFFLLALLLDRRAMLISTQLYVIYALTYLLEDKLNITQNIIIYVMMGFGIFVIYFGTYWYRTRSMIFGFLSGGLISRYIPDLSAKDLI